MKFLSQSVLIVLWLSAAVVNAERPQQASMAGCTSSHCNAYVPASCCYCSGCLPRYCVVDVKNVAVASLHPWWYYPGTLSLLPSPPPLVPARICCCYHSCVTAPVFHASIDKLWISQSVQPSHFIFFNELFFVGSSDQGGSGTDPALFTSGY